MDLRQRASSSTTSTSIQHLREPGDEHGAVLTGLGEGDVATARPRRRTGEGDTDALRGAHAVAIAR